MTDDEICRLLAENRVRLDALEVNLSDVRIETEAAPLATVLPFKPRPA